MERLGLRAVLFAVLGSAAALIGFHFLGEILVDRADAMDRARSDLQRIAVTAAARQDGLLTDTRVLLTQLTVPPRTTQQLIEDCHAHFPSVLEELHWLSTLAVLDTSGRVVCSTYGLDTALDLSDRDYFQNAMAARAFAVSGYLVNGATGRPMLVTAMPRTEDGEVTAVVIGTIDVDWLSATAAGIEGPQPGVEVMILDVSGVIVGGSTGLGERLRGEVLPPSTIGPEERGVIERFPFENRSYVAAYSGLMTTGGTIVVMKARDEIFAAVNTQAIVAVSLLVVLSLLLFGLVWLGGEYFVLRPLRALAGTAKALGSGNYAARTRLSGFAREFQALGGAFNAMGEELQAQNELLAAQALSDGLTGLRNKRAFNEQLAIEIKRSRRERRTLCLLMLDIDNFKRFNDRYGHAAGDDAIAKVAGVIAARARRGGDFAARVGGEEFALILPDCQLEGGREIADEIGRAILALGIRHEDSDFRCISVSIGLTELDGEDSARSFVERSDAALYRSKTTGRNRVETIRAERRELPTENAA